MLARSAGQFAVDHRLAFAQRWGGWYVTGQSGALQHLGNIGLDRLLARPTTDGLNWPSLAGRVDMSAYLSNQSDIVALMVFEHQMHMMNLFTRLGWDARVAAYEASRGNVREKSGAVSLADGAREVVDYLLFIDEAPLLDRVRSATTFADTFSARGPRDRLGRSLYQLDLDHRLTRYPCSYMVYSDVFAALPADARAAVYRRMWQVLSGQEQDRRYLRLTPKDRRAIIEILRETKPDLPTYFVSSTRTH
jgi:hypothetical protein